MADNDQDADIYPPGVHDYSNLADMSDHPPGEEVKTISATLNLFH